MYNFSNLAENNNNHGEEVVVTDLGIGTLNLTEEFLEDEENAELLDAMAKAYEEELYN